MNIKTIYSKVPLSWKLVGSAGDSWMEKVAALVIEGQILIQTNTKPTDHRLRMWRKYVPIPKETNL